MIQGISRESEEEAGMGGKKERRKAREIIDMNG